MHARTVVFGKFMSSIQLIMIVTISSLPVLSIVFVYGGIRFINIIQLLAIIIVSGIYIGSIGIFCSCICKKTTSAIVMAYSMLVGIILITVALNYLFAKTDSDKSYIGNYYALYLNPIATVTQLTSSQLETVSEFERIIFYNIS